MAIPQVSYLPYSAIQSIKADQLINIQNSIINTLFPNRKWSYSDPNVSAFFVLAGSSYTLLLGDALSFSSLRNSCDTLDEICPVIFHEMTHKCSRAFFNIVQAHGQAIEGSPQLIAFQISFNNVHQPFNGNVEELMAHVIQGNTSEGKIGWLKLKRLPNTWQSPTSNPGWKGLAFEQDSHLIKTWVHEKNPQALPAAIQKAQKDISTYEKTVKNKQKEVERAQQAQKAIPILKKLQEELDGAQELLNEAKNALTYATEERVNSAAKSTLQCAITVCLDTPDKKQILESYLHRKLWHLVKQSMEQISWEQLGIREGTIEEFIKRQLKLLDEKVDVLIQNRQSTLTDWKYFKENNLAKQRVELLENYQQFCSRQPSHLSEEEKKSQWRISLGAKLKRIKDWMSMTNEQLKFVRNFTHIDKDISYFENDLENMKRILKQTEKTYRLGKQIEEKQNEITKLRNMQGNVILYKRVTTSGYIESSIEEGSLSNLNEVHIPLNTIR